MIELVPVFLTILYLIPFMVAAGRGHDFLISILVANLLLGWTVIGWFAVFLWAMYSSPKSLASPVMPRRPGDLGSPEARRVKDSAL